MTKRNSILLAAGLAIVVIVAALLAHRQPAMSDNSQLARIELQSSARPANEPITSPSQSDPASEESPRPANRAGQETRRPDVRVFRPAPLVSRPQQPSNGGGAPPAEEPLAPVPLVRQALSFVGADPQANAVWLSVINDPSIEPNARKDLIEDLNEDGFPDPKNITPDDAPLIISRLALIEELAPGAIDDTNAAAFQEAYKDLVKMLVRISRQ